MEQKEDMFQLVLGMASQRDIQNLFAAAPRHGNEETLSKWFDAKAGTIGGQDVVKTVQQVFGNAAKFDYHQVSSVLPRVDLPDLLPFWKNLLAAKERKLFVDEEMLTFNTPEDWRGFGILRKYENLQLSRRPKERDKILGAGHRIFDMGVADALSLPGVVSSVAGLSHDYLVYIVYDKVTDAAKEKGVRTYVCEVDDGRILRVLADWEFLKILNAISPNSSASRVHALSEDVISECARAIVDHVRKDDFAPQLPTAKLVAALLKSEV